MNRKTVHIARLLPTILRALFLGGSCLAGEFAGHTLLFTSVRTGDTEVFTVDLEIGDAKNLTRSPTSEERYPAWSPDGSRVTFTSDRDGTYNLYVMDADGRNVRRLTHEKPPAVCYMASWITFRVTDTAYWRPR